MKRIVARIIDTHIDKNPFTGVERYYLTYSNEDAIKSGNTSTPHFFFHSSFKKDSHRLVKEGTLVELTFGNNGELLALKRIALEKQAKAEQAQYAFDLRSKAA